MPKKRHFEEKCQLAMANKRQRLAKQRFSESQPQEPSSSAASAPDSSFNPALHKTRSHKIAKKHPLRVPGKKPGDGCFLCKSPDHIAKYCPQKLGKDKKTICLLCRALGHTLKNCPSKLDGQEKKCYNCGESGHRLAECKAPLKEGGTKFAECFLCKQEGHLSKNCPSNPHGIYPKGGSCKVCGGVTHLAKDCPEKNNSVRPTGAQRGKLFISKEAAPTSGNNPKRIVFGGGDDLDDDFACMEDDEIEAGSSKAKKGKAPKSMSSKNGLSAVKSVVKKAKNSPKIVNFKG